MSSTNERDEQDGGQRGRPGRRSLQDRQGAVLELLQGKSTIDQIARRLGVRSETVAGWRDAAPPASKRPFSAVTGRPLESAIWNRRTTRCGTR